MWRQEKILQVPRMKNHLVLICAATLIIVCASSFASAADDALEIDISDGPIVIEENS
jgi:hypothetical protein